MIKPCGLVCAAYLYALAVLCPIASVALLIALCSPPRLSSRLCCHRRCLNLACLHASPHPQHLSCHRLLALPSTATTHNTQRTMPQMAAEPHLLYFPQELSAFSVLSSCSSAASE
jgi:hypothetical protein